MAFEDITESQRKLLENLVQSLATGNFSSQFWALATLNRGWFIELNGQGGAKSKDIGGFEETDLHALDSEGYITLIPKKHGYAASLKPKTYNEYKASKATVNLHVSANANVIAGRDISTHKTEFDEEHLKTIEVTSRDLITELRQNYDLSRKQAASWFRCTLVLSLAGFAVLGVGIWLLLADKTTASTFNLIAGAMSEFLAVVFFKQVKAANDRQDRYHSDLILRQKVLDAVQVVRLITDDRDRNRVTETIIRQLLGVETASHNAAS